MKIIHTLSFTILMIVLLTSYTYATDYFTIKDGNAASDSIWSGGIVPASFGGTGGKEKTITINNNVFYDADYYIPNNCTFTIALDATFDTRNFTFIGNNKILILNGSLICDGIFIDYSTGFSGSGTIIASDIQGTIPDGITHISGANFWNGSINTDWTNTGNWSFGTVPTSGEWAAISIEPTNWPVISTTELIKGLTIAHDQHFIVAPNGSLQLDTLYTYGNLYIQSDETGTGNIYTNYALGYNGTVELQRYLADNKWHIISSPVSESLGDFYTDNSANIRDNGTYQAFGTYDESADDWSLYLIGAPSGNFEKGNGYIISTSAGSTVIFKGENIDAGPITKSIAANNYGWNAIGNPYPSALQVTGANSFLESNSSLLAPGYEGLYVWDPNTGGTGDYIVIADAGYSFPAPGGESQLNQDQITVGQGFMVKAASTGSLTFNSFMQRLSSATPFKSSSIQAPALQLTIKSGDHTNQTIVGFKKNMTMGLDPGNDLGKLKGNPDIALYTQLVDHSSEIDFAIQTLPYQSFELRNIPVGLDLKNGGKTTFTLETVNFPENAQVYLEDRVLNTLTQLNIEIASYTVTLPSINGYGRFNLIITNFTAKDLTSLVEQQDPPDFSVFTRDKMIMVMGRADNHTQIAVYGIDGKTWYRNRAEVSNRNNIDAANFPSGIYLVKINKSGKLQTFKVLLTNNR